MPSTRPGLPVDLHRPSQPVKATVGLEIETMKNDSRSIFLLGAGFTKAAFPQAPLNRDLLGAISKDNGKTLSKYKNKYETNDIEKLLTQFDLEAAEKDEIAKDRSFINAEIASYFAKFRFSKINANIPSWLETFALNILDQNDAIVCLNYDCFLEGALDSLGVWSPSDGYARINNFLTASFPQNPKNIKIYKIHGSENFVESSVIGKNPKQTAIGFLSNPTIYPRSSAHSHFGGGAKDPQPYIIAPSFVKIPHVDIAAVMLDLLHVAEAAKNLVIIGCGMRREDNFLWLVLTRFLNKILEPRHRLIILSPSAEVIWKRISDYWVGDICSFIDVCLIPCGIEEGIHTLTSAIGSKPSKDTN